MSETGDFLLLHQNSKLFLIFKSAKNTIYRWYIPNCSSFESLQRQIAIQTDLLNSGNSINTILNNESAEKSNEIQIIDRGDLDILKKSRYKIKFKLIGKTINKTFIMVVPSWGRWTKNNIWLIITSKE